MKKTTKISKCILLILLILVSVPSKSETLYKQIKKDGKIRLVFNESWFFNKITLPVKSLGFWGDEKAHNIVMLDLGKEKHILSSQKGESLLVYTERTEALNQIEIISINTSDEAIEERTLEFCATSSKTKEIEDEILLILKDEKNWVSQNNCFSCHSTLPMALTLNEAISKGFKIEAPECESFIKALCSQQNDDGSFFYPTHPEYGKNITTLAAVFSISLLSGFSKTSFEKTGKKAVDFLKKAETKNEVIKSDFLFEPFFNEYSTPLLLESVFQRILYLSNPQDNQYSLIRANSLLRKYAQFSSFDLKDKILILCGIPYSCQLQRKEIDKINKELENYLANIESKSSNILKLLGKFAYEKTKLPSYQIHKRPKNNSKSNYSSRVWKYFEKVLYNEPKYINGMDNAK